MDFSNKTVLVTGATGLIGSHIVDTLMNFNGVKVIASVRNRIKFEKMFSAYIGKETFSYIVHDISTSKIDSDETIDYIFHTAGPISSNIINCRPVDVISPNLDGLKKCLEFLRKQQKGRLILFSSATIYNRALQNDIIVNEGDTAVTDSLDNPQAIYSQTKRMCELLGRAYLKQYGVDVVIARIAYVYGYTKIFPETAIYQFISKAIEGQNIQLKAASFANRDNIYIQDAVSGLLRICLYGKYGEAYNISSRGELGNYASIDVIAKYIARAANRQLHSHISVDYLCPDKMNYLPGIILDNSKLKKLGRRLETEMSQGIDEIVKLSLLSKERM